MISKQKLCANICACFFLAAALFLSSCKKSTSGDGEEGGENTFVIEGKTYTATSVSYMPEQNMLRAQRIAPGSGLNEIESVSIVFSDEDLPTTGGSFDIVSDPYSPGDRTNNNQVSLYASTFPYDYGSYMDNNLFYPKLSPVQHVTVTITNNKKINVKFSGITVSSQTGVSTISGNITQP